VPTARPVSAFSPTSAGSGPSSSPRNGSASKSPLAGPYSPYSPIALSSPPSANKKREDEELLVLSGRASNGTAPASEAVVTSTPDSGPVPAVTANVSSSGPELKPVKHEIADEELLVLSGKPTVTIPDLAELTVPAQEESVEAREESPKQDEALFVLDGHLTAAPASPTGSRSPLRGAPEKPFAASDSATPSSPEQEMLVLSGMEVDRSQAAESEETPEASSAEPAELQSDEDADELADLEFSAEAVETRDDAQEGSDLADAADGDDDTVQSAGMAAEGEPAEEGLALEEEEDANAVDVSPDDALVGAGEEQEEGLSYADEPAEDGENGYVSDNYGEEGPVAMQPLDTYFETPEKSDELGEDESEDVALAAELDMPLAAADAAEEAADEPIPAMDETEEDAAEAADASEEGPVPMTLETTEVDQQPEDDLDSRSSSTVAEDHSDDEAGEPEAQTAASKAPESVAAATEPSAQSAEEESSYSSPERKTSAGTSAVDELQFTTPREAPAATPDEVCLVVCLYELLRLRCYRCGSTLMKAKLRKPVAVRCEFSMCSPDS
jgi:hypothetical protein